MSDDEDQFHTTDLDIDLSFLHSEESAGSDNGLASSIFPQSQPQVLKEIPSDTVVKSVTMPVTTVTDHQDSSLRPNTTSATAPRAPTKGLATWTFNKKKRKRVYISLTGKKMTGPEAVRQCRLDKASSEHPFRVARSDLIQAVALKPSHLPPTDCSNHSDDYDESHCLLADWGVPASTASRYAEVGGVHKMFKWQKECLSAGGGASVLRGRNLIYSAPTSGGKTLVAEVLMLRRLGARVQEPKQEYEEMDSLTRRGTNAVDGVILFVVPFISLAEEKASYFQDTWKHMYIGVRSFHGEDDGAPLTDDVDVAVCTFEKANVLINQLLDEGRESRLIMVVVDELHLVSDTQRGFLLEVLLTKVKHCMPSCQIVGMSATLPNMSDLAKWLDATLFTTAYRPVELTVRVCCDRKLYEIKSDVGSTSEMSFAMDRTVPNLSTSCISDSVSLKEPTSSVPINPEMGSNKLFDDDPEGFLSLVLETLQLRKSVMVFCNSKRRCELCVDRIAKVIKLLQPQAILKSRDETGLMAQRLQLLQQLRETPVGLCPLLHSSLLSGVAYHHAGLTMDERKLLEEAYRKGVVVVLCTTSTLAAGVNLPAHRVIIRTPSMGASELSVAAFRQMCGRAGRLGLDENGEAILIIPSLSRQFKALAVHLVTADMPPLVSSLQTAQGGGLEKLLLEMIYCQKIKSVDDVEKFVASTLMSVQQSEDNVKNWTDKALKFLQQHQFLLQYRHSTCTSNGVDSLPVLASSPLGRATTLSGVSPNDAVLVLSSLQQARKRLILQSGFHVIFLVTPPSTHIQPNWECFEMLLDGVLKDHPGILPVVELLGASRGDLCNFKQSPPKFNCTKPKSLFYRRFYSAILLFNLIQEIPLNKISQWVDLQRGQLQQLQKDASAFCGMIVSFCEKLNWVSLKCVLATYTSRLMFGVKPELLPLTRLGSEMPGFRARAFFKSGVRSIEDIVASNPIFLRNILLDCLPFEGNDPLHARKNNTKATMDPSLSSCQFSRSNDEVDSVRRHEEQSCMSLAIRIINIAKDKVKQDVHLQIQEKELIHGVQY